MEGRRVLWQTCCWAVLVLLAIGLHVPYVDRQVSPTSGFRRGSYAVLVTAEKDLKGARTESALAGLKIAFVRALYEGQGAVAERIRYRVGTAGIDLLKSKASDPWPFFEAFALLSPEFNAASLQVEDCLLGESASKLAGFEYRILMKDGRTFWNARSSRGVTSVRRLVGWWQVRTGHFSGETFDLKLRAEKPAQRYYVIYPMRMSCGSSARAAEGWAAVHNASRPICWFDLSGTYNEARPIDSVRWQAEGLFLIPTQALNKVVILSDQWNAEAQSISIFHVYHPL